MKILNFAFAVFSAFLNNQTEGNVFTFTMNWVRGADDRKDILIETE